MGRLRVEVLGRPTVVHGGRAPTLGTKATALVHHLAVTGRPVPRAVVAELLWGTLPPDRARANLRTVLAELRHTLGAHLDITAREVGPATGWEVDLDTLRAALRADRVALDADHVTDVDRIRRLARGRLLDGLDLPGAPGFETWVVTIREQVRRELLDGLSRFARELAGSDRESALALARQQLVLDPLDEAAHRLVMELLAATGRRAAALAQYATCRHVLAAELGVDPSPETARLHLELLRRDGAPTAVVAGGSVALPRRPEGPLLGRDRELARLMDLLRAERLVTLVGPGGVGKTRLALAAVTGLEAPDDDGATAWVPLAALPPSSDTEVVAATVADALGLPPTRTRPLAALSAAMRDRRGLLVLDSAEHLDLGELVRAVLDAAAEVTVLVTSRRRLGMAEEWLVELGGLDRSGEATGDPSRSPAVALLAERTRRVRPDLEVAQDPAAWLAICRLVEGLPLALELAADAMRALDPAEVAQALADGLDVLSAGPGGTDGAPRTMRAVLESTWSLLDVDDRAMLARLSVFHGAFDVAGAAAVADAAPANARRRLVALVDRGVLERRPGGRFGLHELLRRLARERLASDPGQDDRATRAHARHLAAAAAAAVADGIATRDDVAVAFEPDLADLRAATDRLVDGGGDEEALDACLTALWSLDERRGRFAASLERVEAACARPDITPARAASWHRIAGTAAYELGRLDRAMTELEAAVAAAGRPLPRGPLRRRAVMVGCGLHQLAHRVLPPRRHPSDGTDVARVEALSLLANACYLRQEPLPVLLYALLEADTADHGDDPSAATCAYAELGHVLMSLGWHRVARRYGAMADAHAARASRSRLTEIGLETRAMSHLGLGAWEEFDALEATVRGTSSPGHHQRSWAAVAGAAALVRGDFDDAYARFTTTLEDAEVAGDDLAWVWCAGGLTDAALGLGADLAPHLDRQVETVERSRGLAAPEQLKSLAVLAAVRLVEGDDHEALVLARAADVVLGQVAFAPAWALDAYSHLAQVWLDRWARPQPATADVERGACRAAQALEAFARAYPVGAPRAAWVAGWIAALRGRPRRARTIWRRSLADAGRLGLVYDQARAHLALATVVGGADADEHRARADALLAGSRDRPHLLQLGT
jgi:predicted ATPase/DNA-binding SARP family transcriptional activator